MPSILCIMLAFLLFCIDASSRWWPYTPNPAARPWYPTLQSLGLAFLVLGVWLLPLMK
jgi:hypothetical protein